MDDISDYSKNEKYGNAGMNYYNENKESHIKKNIENTQNYQLLAQNLQNNDYGGSSYRKKGNDIIQDEINEPPKNYSKQSPNNYYIHRSSKNKKK